MNHWDNPLGLATRHDKMRDRAEKLRKEADKCDLQADELARRYEEAMAASAERLEQHLAALKR